MESNEPHEPREPREDQEFVTHYTYEEGGRWIELTGQVQITIQEFLRITNTKYHSFKTSKGRRWDVINGFTKL